MEGACSRWDEMRGVPALSMLLSSELDRNRVLASRAFWLARRLGNWTSPVPVGKINLSYWIAIALGALLYIGAAKAGLVLSKLQGNAAPVWPASGIAVALLMS